MNMVRITTVHLILATILMNLEVRIDNLILVIENTVPHGLNTKKSFSRRRLYEIYQMKLTLKINILYTY